jgi:hypothetical protein
MTRYRIENIKFKTSWVLSVYKKNGVPGTEVQSDGETNVSK